MAKDVVNFAGEPDPIKLLQFLPGVQSGNEGTINLSVRGGSFDQNLYLLDEAPVYNPSHALSFFSVFNVDALQNISFYKSAIPVRYGGRLSSVVDLTMEEGNRKKQTVAGSVGTIASKLSIEGPLSSKSDKWSYMASGRYSYAGQIVNGIYLLGQYVLGDPTANISTIDNKIDFFDFNGKINFRMNDKNHFYLSTYMGRDNFYFNHITNGYALSWGNQTMSFRWNKVHNHKLFSNTTAVYSRYGYKYNILNNTQYFAWEASLSSVNLKQDYDFYLNNKNHLTFGWALDVYAINPGSLRPRAENAPTTVYNLNKQEPVMGQFANTWQVSIGLWCAVCKLRVCQKNH